ncbi:tRNA nucleotidyltransferase [Bacillus sp. A17A.1]
MVKQEETHGCGVQFVMKNIPFFSDMFQYNQGNPYHSLPLCQHTYMVYAHLTENYVGKIYFFCKVLQHSMIQVNRFAVYLKSSKGTIRIMVTNMSVLTSLATF